ncbi:hypothetical protein [Nonomuraea sp. JJY05]
MEYGNFLIGDPAATGQVDIRWVPYMVFFNRAEYHSEVINTDRRGSG